MDTLESKKLFMRDTTKEIDGKTFNMRTFFDPEKGIILESAQIKEPIFIPKEILLLLAEDNNTLDSLLSLYYNKKYEPIK